MFSRAIAIGVSPFYYAIDKVDHSLSETEKKIGYIAFPIFSVLSGGLFALYTLFNWVKKKITRDVLDKKMEQAFYQNIDLKKDRKTKGKWTEEGFFKGNELVIGTRFFQDKNNNLDSTYEKGVYENDKLIYGISGFKKGKFQINSLVLIEGTKVTFYGNQNEKQEGYFNKDEQLNGQGFYLHFSGKSEEGEFSNGKFVRGLRKYKKLINGHTVKIKETGIFLFSQLYNGSVVERHKLCNGQTRFYEYNVYKFKTGLNMTMHNVD